TLYSLFDRAAREYFSPGKKDPPGTPASALGGVADSVGKPASAVAPETAAAAPNKYAEAVKKLVALFKSKETKYGHQTEQMSRGEVTWEQRKQDYLSDDAF